MSDVHDAEPEDRLQACTGKCDRSLGDGRKGGHRVERSVSLDLVQCAITVSVSRISLWLFHWAK
jgi:hypothetical protein